MRILPERLINAIPKEVLTYPSLEKQEELKRKLAGHYAVKPSQICLGSGSAEIIDGITAAFGRKILTFVPTFFLFDFFSKKYGSDVEFLPWPWRNNEIDIPAGKLSDISLIWICNPNNPTGHWIDPSFIIKTAAKTDAIIAVDENFSLFKDPDGIPLAAMSDIPPNIVSVIGFSKIFGIPGQRLGFAIGEKSVITKINSLFEYYHVNALAVKYGMMTLEYWVEYKKLIKEVIERRHDLLIALEKMGYELLPGFGSWVAMKFNDPDQTEKFKLLLESKGVRGLPFFEFEFSYSSKDPYFRLAVPSAEEYEGTLASLRDAKKVL
jgi:histidinol-phosphate/aromatic aminotransferase/cobyric acid decarboxylase-like protein